MAKRIAVHRRLVARGLRTALGTGAGEFAADILSRTRWRARRGGVPLFFAQGRQHRLQHIEQRFDFSFNILVRHAIHPAGSLTFHLPAEQGRRAGGRETVSRIVSSERMTLRSNRSMRTETQLARVKLPGGLVMRHVASPDVNAVHAPAASVSRSLTRHVLENRTTVRSATERNLVLQDRSVVSRLAKNPNVRTTVLPVASLSTRSSLLRTLITLRPTSLFVSPLLPRQMPVAQQVTSALERREVTRVSRRSVAVASDSQISIRPAEVIGFAPARRSAAVVTARSHLVASAPLRLRNVERASARRREPLLPPGRIRVRPAQTPEGVSSNRPPFAADLPTPPLVYARAGAREGSGSSRALTRLGEGTARAEPSPSVTTTNRGASPAEQTAFRLRSANPPEIQALSQRVYELIVDRVRREKERLGR